MDGTAGKDVAALAAYEAAGHICAVVSARLRLGCGQIAAAAAAQGGMY